ncbi:Uncharacterised protein [Mycobacteroides abscessus subsp. massiliense]|nr:Uncharacterised protein [Mycobacteroides abscessus subsp. massiliense]
MAFQCGVAHRTRRRWRDGLAVVVVITGEQGAAAQQRQHQRTGHQVRNRPADDPDTRAPPELGGQFAPRLDPPAGPGQHQDGGQQRHPGQVCHADPDRRRHADRLEDAHLGEAQQQEGDAHRGGRRGDHLSDRHHRGPDGLVVVLTRPQVVVIAADEEDGIVRAGAGQDRAQEHDGLVRHARAGQLRIRRHHRLGDDQR